MKSNFYENDYAEYWIEEGIVMQYFKPEVVKIHIGIAKRIVQDRLAFVTKGVPMPLFVDTNNGLDLDKESRTYFASEESLCDIKASALLIHSPITFVAAKLFLVISRPKAQFQFFAEKKKALEWLQKYR